MLSPIVLYLVVNHRTERDFKKKMDRFAFRILNKGYWRYHHKRKAFMFSAKGDHASHEINRPRVSFRNLKEYYGAFIHISHLYFFSFLLLCIWCFTWNNLWGESIPEQGTINRLCVLMPCIMSVRITVRIFWKDENHECGRRMFSKKS